MQNLQIIPSGLENLIHRNCLAINCQKQIKFTRKNDKQQIKQVNIKRKRKQKLHANKAGWVKNSFNLATKIRGSGKKQLSLIGVKSGSCKDSEEKCSDILFMLFYL